MNNNKKKNIGQILEEQNEAVDRLAEEDYDEESDGGD
jgi:hypothetical protein